MLYSLYTFATCDNSLPCGNNVQSLERDLEARVQELQQEVDSKNQVRHTQIPS